ncbi:MAG: MerR family transcriptional regulator [Pseudonocardia sp.]|nr:MerR family transcriptional regulator [Pseudonocardia sp.]
MSQGLLTTAAAARELSVHAATLTRWAREGRVTPANTTAGGHARWDLDDLRRQLDAIKQQQAREAGQSDA